MFNKVECHPYLGQEKLRVFCKQRDIFIMAYSPLNAPDKSKKSKKSEYKNMDVFQESIIQEMAKKIPEKCYSDHSKILGKVQ